MNNFFVIKVLSKILLKEFESNKVGKEQITFATNLEAMFLHHIRTFGVPVGHFENILICLITFSKITKGDTISKLIEFCNVSKNLFILSYLYIHILQIINT